MRSHVVTTIRHPRTRVAALVAVEAAAIPVILWLGRIPFLRTPGLRAGAWAAWLRVTAPQDAVAASLRWVAAAGAAWLLASTLLYLAARLTHLPTLDWLTPRAIRRLVDAALALSITAAVLSGGVAGAQPPPVPIPYPLPAPGAPPPTAPPPASNGWTVRAGDNLWSIAARVDHAHTARYWASLVALDTPHLRSRNPNLIFPGEQLALPPSP